MSGRSTSGFTRDNSGGYSRDNSGGYSRDNSGGYTGSTRTPSTVVTVRDMRSRGSISDSIIDVSGSRSMTRSSSNSSVPKLYGSLEQRSIRAKLGTPSGERRLALTERLRAATSPAASGALKASTLADRYTPSQRVRSQTSTKAKSDARSRAEYPGTVRTAAKPGAARRTALAPAQESRRTKQKAASAKSSKSSKGTAKKADDNKSLRDRYNAAKAKDRELAHRMEKAAAAAAQATDLATRAALASNPLTRGASGYGYGNGTNSGAGSSYGDDPWAGYYGGTYTGNQYGGGYGWYWNNCYPSYCSWLFGCTSWWYPNYGFSLYWGSSWGFGYGWHSPSYYSSYSNCYWPTYAYCSPSAVYRYIETPVYVEVPVEKEQAGPAVAAAPVPAPTLNHRAASEYMALGDRAFVEGRYGDAVHYYAKAIEFEPEDGVLYLVLSDALFATGDYHYAAYAIRMALEKTPELASLGLDKRDFYGNPADFDAQLTMLEGYLADHVLDDDARLLLAANYLFSMQAERCVSLLDNPFSEDLKGAETGQLISAAALAALATN